MTTQNYTPFFESKTIIHTYRDRKVFDINHSVSRFESRFPELDIADYFKALNEGIDIILDVFKDNKNRYMIISKSKQFAIQLTWEAEQRSNSKVNQGFTATTLDYNTQKEMLRGDLKIFVERMKKDNIKIWFKEQDEAKFLKEVGYYSIKIEECNDYTVYVKEGEIVRNFVMIEVE